MSVPAIGNNNISDVYSANTTSKEKSTSESTKAAEQTTAAEQKPAESTANTAAVYDKSKLSEDDRKALVAQLKADQEKRQAQFTDLVKSMMTKQGTTFNNANGIWSFLAKGNFTVDEATKKKAQEDISEDGYWGVKQTSDRIVQFATSLAGTDQKALEKMRDAFLKGYKKAEKTWGGKLPEISQKTYDAVLEKFDKLLKPKTENNSSADKNAADKNTTDKNTTDKVTTTEDGTVVAKSE